MGYVWRGDSCSWVDEQKQISFGNTLSDSVAKLTSIETLKTIVVLKSISVDNLVSTTGPFCSDQKGTICGENGKCGCKDSRKWYRKLSMAI